MTTRERVRRAKALLVAALEQARSRRKKPGVTRFSYGVDCANEPGNYYRIEGPCCGLGAVLVGRRYRRGYSEDAAKILGISREEAGEFVGGFDCVKRPGFRTPFGMLGYSLAKRFVNA